MRWRRRGSPTSGGGGWLGRGLLAIGILVAIIGAGLLVPAHQFTSVTIPRDTGADLVDDPSGVIGLDSTGVGTGTVRELVTTTNNFDQPVDLTVRLGEDWRDRATLLVDGVDHGDSATLTDLGAGASRGVDVALACRDGLADDAVAYEVEVSGGGIGGRIEDRSAPIERHCLTWYADVDWDAAPTDRGLVHDDYGDHAATDVRLGYEANRSGLIAYWPLDEDSGSSAVDVAGTNDGSVSGTTLGAVGVLGTTAHSADGNGDAMTVPDATALDLTGNLTAAAWIHPDTTVPVYDVNASGYVSHQLVGMTWAGGATDCTSDAGFDPSLIHPYDDASVGSDTWQAGSFWEDYDTTQPGVYGDYGPRMIDFDTVWGTDVDNGEAYAAVFVHSPDDRSVDVSIGSDDTRRLWVNGVLMHEECVDQALTVDDSTVSNVPLDAGWNTVVVMVNENTGGWGLQWRFSANANNLQYTADPQVLMDKQGYQLARMGGDVTATYGGTTVDAPAPEGDFSHVAMRANGTHVGVFVNGTERAASTYSSAPAGNTEPLVLGHEFDGRYDEVRLYDRALAGAAMERLARGASPPDPSADWNGTLVTDWERADVDLAAGDLRLSDVVANVSAGSATVSVESDTDDDGVPEETSDPVTLTDSTGPYDVTGLATDSDRFRLRVELSTPSITESPCFSGATLSPGGGLTVGNRSGCGETNVTQNEAPSAAFDTTSAPWYDESWGHRKAITIDHARVAADLTDYPLLVSITDADLSAGAQPDADDLRFTAGDGTTLLAHEVETYNASTGSLRAWVSVPTVNATAPDTTVYLYYNNSAAANAEDPAGVWSNGYGGVWHLNETPADGVAGHLDSTSSDNAATPMNLQDGGGGTTDAAGRIDGADALAGDDDYLQTASELAALRSTATLSFWINTTQTGDDTMWQAPGVSGIEEEGGGDDVFWGWINGSGHVGIQASDAAAAMSDTRIADGSWHHVVVTRTSGSGVVEVYVDGTLEDTATSAAGDVTNTFSSLGRIEDTGGTPEYLAGSIDEVRISSSVRPAAWIETVHANTNEPGSFVAVGAEESPGDTVLDASASSDPDGSVATYKWDYESDGVYDAVSTTPTTSHSFDTGVHDVTLQVVDDDSATDATTSSIVVGNPVPKPAFDASSWETRRLITIDHRQVGANLTDFPLLVSITDPGLADAQVGGDDVRFTTADGSSLLAHEIESVDTASGELVAWVRVPRVNATAPNTTIALHYDNPAAPDGENASGVWDSRYAMVQHFDESSGAGTAVDSTANDNDGTTVDATQGASGLVAGGYDFDAGAGEGVEVPDDPSLDITTEVTLSAWIHPDAVGDWNRIVAKSHTANEDPWTIYGLLFDDANHLRMELSDCTAAGCQSGANGATTVPTTNWVHATVTYDGATMRVYYNGTQDGSTSVSTSIATNDMPLTIGKSGYDWDYYDGRMDEVRVSDTARSSAWIEAVHANTADPGGFYSVGAEDASTLVRLDATNASDPGGAIATYEWDVTSDGTYEITTTSAVVHHHYGSGGSYDVTLRVTDDTGQTNTTTDSIDV